MTVNINKYLVPNSDYIVGAVVQASGKFIFGSHVSSWQKNDAGKYLIPFDLMAFRSKRDETIPECINRLCQEELGGGVELVNMKGGTVGVLTPQTFLNEQMDGAQIQPMYISKNPRATSTKINAESYIITLIYSGKSNNASFKSLNMQALYKTPPSLLRRIAAGNVSIGDAVKEGLEIMDNKIEIPEDSILVPQKNFLEFLRFLKESSK